MHPHRHVANDDQVQTLDIRVTGPDCDPLPAGDMRRLFPGSMLTEARLDRLQTWSRVTVHCGDQIVAVATCNKNELELRVPDIGLDRTCGCSTPDVIHALLDALELAGIAGGCRRLVLMPPKEVAAPLDRWGYVTIAERCAGGWLEKPLA